VEAEEGETKKTPKELELEKMDKILEMAHKRHNIA